MKKVQTKLVIAPPGKWERSNEQVVEISEMVYPHLTNALRIVQAKHVEAKLAVAEMEKLQAEYKTGKDPQAIAALGEASALVDALEAKREELENEIAARPPPPEPKAKPDGS